MNPTLGFTGVSVPMEPVLLLLLVVPLCWGHSEYQGKVVTYYRVGTNSDGTVRMVFRYKSNTVSCINSNNRCPTDGCATISYIVTPIDKSSGGFCQVESVWTRDPSSDGPFTMESSPFDWSSPIVNEVFTAQAIILVDMRNRSDTGQANRCPQTTIQPIFGQPWNCPGPIHLLSFDPDGDLVHCRFATSSSNLNECADCTPPSVLSLSAPCSVSFSASQSSQGRYAVQMVMEDYPQTQIILTNTNGQQEVKDPTMSISKIPVQFLFTVEPAAPSCSLGLYLPLFVTPTPTHGAQISVQVEETLYIHIEAKASESTVSELVFSGPSRMTKAGSGGQYVLSWTPVASEEGQSHPVCFNVRATFMMSKFTSSLRCVVLNVKKKIKEVQTFKVWMSSSALLSDEAMRTALLGQIRMELEKNKLPSDISVRLSNVIQAIPTAESPPRGGCPNV
ncbi:uncharacterized protein LOC110163438 [Boleophthalmus pectinirostris]|uniref:uncharacterized protein LOC110163438 n=1 Tax=Boleophthalmus pectinirostris TaxID=150288 RepID=UPI00242E0C3C|nr:uncharacterized protein LOC110163438 [Boleophthalmus pectinirostris]